MTPNITAVFNLGLRRSDYKPKSVFRVFLKLKTFVRRSFSVITFFFAVRLHYLSVAYVVKSLELREKERETMCVRVCVCVCVKEREKAWNRRSKKEGGSSTSVTTPPTPQTSLSLLLHYHSFTQKARSFCLFECLMFQFVKRYSLLDQTYATEQLRNIIWKSLFKKKWKKKFSSFLFYFHSNVDYEKSDFCFSRKTVEKDTIWKISKFLEYWKKISFA